MCVLISEADRVLYFTTALPPADISSEPTPSTALCSGPASIQVSKCGSCCLLSPSPPPPPPPAISYHIPRINVEYVHARLQLGVRGRRVLCYRFEGVPAATLGKDWRVFLLGGRVRGFQRGNPSSSAADMPSKSRQPATLQRNPPPVTAAEAELSNKPLVFLLLLHNHPPWKSLQEDSRYIVLDFS